MRISIASDLHLEFADIALAGGDVLILAGDIWTAAAMSYTRSNAEKWALRKRYERFAKEELAKYRRVLLVLGNHEFYGSNLDDAPELVHDFLARHAPHARLLDNDVEDINGVRFIGTTLWAPCGVGKPITEMAIARGMNDFKLIKSLSGMLFTPAQAADFHAQDCAWLREEIEAAAGMRCVVITHHAPSILCDSHGGTLGEAYCSNQHGLIEANPHVALWAFGHTHESARLTIGETEIVSNPRGYAGHQFIAEHFNVTAADRIILKKRGRKKELHAS